MADNVPVHAPLYASPLLYECPDYGTLSVVCETKAERIKDLLSPSPFEYVVNRFVAYVCDMQKCTKLGPFNDSGIIVPAKFGNVVGGYVAYEFVTSDVAMAAGREPWGYPKKMADVTISKEGNRVHGTLTRRGEMLMDLTCELTSERLDLPDVPTSPTLLYQVVPRPDGPGALIRRVISRHVAAFNTEQGTKQYGKAKAVFGESKENPLYELGPVKSLGAIYTTGHYKSTWGKVLATLECNI